MRCARCRPTTPDLVALGRDDRTDEPIARPYPYVLVRAIERVDQIILRERDRRRGGERTYRLVAHHDQIATRTGAMRAIRDAAICRPLRVHAGLGIVGEPANRTTGERRDEQAAQLRSGQ